MKNLILFLTIWFILGTNLSFAENIILTREQCNELSGWGISCYKRCFANCENGQTQKIYKKSKIKLKQDLYEVVQAMINKKFVEKMREEMLEDTSDFLWSVSREPCSTNEITEDWVEFKTRFGSGSVKCQVTDCGRVYQCTIVKP